MTTDASTPAASIGGASALDRHVDTVARFVEHAVAAQHAVARAQAAQAAVLAAAHSWVRGVAAQHPGASSRTADLELRDLSAQIGAAIRVSDRTVQAQMDAATTLTALFPATMAAWAAAEIDRLHMTAIVEAGTPIVDEAARAWFEQRALALAGELTAAQLRPAVRTLAEHAHPEPLAARHERARGGRRVTVTDLDDGMARILAELPAALAYGIHDRLTALAHDVRAAGDDHATPPGDDHATLAGDHHPAAAVPDLVEGVEHDTAPGHAPSEADSRGMDELRADIFADLLLSGAPTGHGEGLDRIAGRVQVTIPVLTAVGRSHEPCVLAGYGPIPLDQALRLAGAASGWDRVMTSPLDGSVMGVDRYRPSEQLRRLLRARDEHCRFVGCRQPAQRCDADHTVDHAQGGATHADNLATLCRRHHVLKHRSGWRVRQLGRGRLRWQSPTGRDYVDRPAPTVRFVSDADPPPPVLESSHDL